MEWQSIESAPFGTDLQLSVIERGEVHALVFPCRRVDGSWKDAKSNQFVAVKPTHWRPWAEATGASSPT